MTDAPNRIRVEFSLIAFSMDRETQKANSCKLFCKLFNQKGPIGTCNIDVARTLRTMCDFEGQWGTVDEATVDHISCLAKVYADGLLRQPTYIWVT